MTNPEEQQEFKDWQKNMLETMAMYQERLINLIEYMVTAIEQQNKRIAKLESIINRNKEDK